MSSASPNPFEAPKEDPSGYVEILPGEYPRRFRRDPTGLTATLKAFLWISLVVHFLRLACEGITYSAIIGETIAEEILGAMATCEVALAIIGGLIFIITAFVFLKWVYRMSLNVHGFGARHLSTTPGWAIAWYFVPIAFLWKPYKTMKETWQASSNPRSWPHVSGTGLVGIWWALYLSAGVLNYLCKVSVRAAQTREDWGTSLLLGMGVAAAWGVLCLILIRLVSRICGMQKAWVEGEPMETSWDPGR